MEREICIRSSSFTNNMLTIAVTGATGFIGNYVIQELAHHNVKVIAGAHAKITDLPQFKNCTWVNIDIASKEQDHYQILGRPDILIHLAWQGLPNYLSNHHFETELPVQYGFLKQMVMSGLKSVIATGTCFEYGMQYGPLAASIETFPSNPYGFAKDALRKQLQYLQFEQSFDLTWTRLFYMYGDMQSPTSLYSLLKNAVEQGLTEFNMSGGEQLRDYMPVAEIARKLVAFALAPVNNGVVNICSGKPVSVRNLVEKWMAENNWNIKLNLGHYPYPSYEPMAFWGA